MGEYSPIKIGRQKIQVSLTHANKTAEVTVGPDTYQRRTADWSPSPVQQGGRLSALTGRRR
jgi:hypothetical protein